MTDIVREFEQYCADNSIIFHYGEESHINLIESNNLATQIYLLMFPPERSLLSGQIGQSFRQYRYSGRFMLMVPADFSQQYHKEINHNAGKYETNIEPLLEAFKSFGEHLIKCGRFELSNWTNKDAINYLDANKDGLWCTYSITQLI